MIDGAPDALLAGFVSWEPRVASWLDGVLLAGDIPVDSGRITWTRSQQVPDALTLKVPRYGADGTDYLPGNNPTAPLARFGQMLDVRIIVRSQIDGLEYEHRRGMFPIQEWKYDGDFIEVTAAGMLQVAADARLLTPLAPRSSGTLASEFRRLLPAGVAAEIDTSLTDRACPQSFEWAEDRLGALYDIADAWPARILADGNGQIQVLAPLADVPTAVVTLKDGEGGTLVDLSRSDTRAGAYNVVVARSSDTDGESSSPVYAVASTTSGPMAVDTYREVPRFYSSPLITTYAQALSAAQKLLGDARRPSRVIPVEIVPDPRLEIDDAAEVLANYSAATGSWATTEYGYIVGVDMPLTANDGAMRVDVAVG